MSRILVIDDEKTCVQIFRRLLEAGIPDVKTFGAYDGKSGLRLARHKKPDLILLDLHMPGMSGIDVLEALGENERTSSVPVIVVTGDTEEDIRDEAMSRYADQYLVKPVAGNELIDMVRRTLALVHSY